MSHRWFVIHTEARAEYLASYALNRDGYQTYFPRIRAAYPRLGHMNTPLFPGYLFLRLDPDNDGWPVFRPSHKIVGYVRFGIEIPSLSDTVVNDLMERVSSINEGGKLPIAFQEGDVVEVTMSSFNTTARVLESGNSSKGTVKVLLEFMGRLVNAEVPWQHIQSVIPENQPESVDSDIGTSQLPRRTRGKGRWIRGAKQLANTTH